MLKNLCRFVSLATIALLSLPCFAADPFFGTDATGGAAIYRPGNFLFNTGSGFSGSFACGAVGDVPVPGNYSGSALLEATVFRPTTGEWITCTSSGVSAVTFGVPGDLPVPGDFDRDGLTDLAVFRRGASRWLVKLSGGGELDFTLGAPGVTPLVGDYDGDGKADAAVFARDWASQLGTWTVLLSSGGTFSEQFGLAGDSPVVGDFNGDGLSDLTVYRALEGKWYSRLSGGGGDTSTFLGVQFDIPAPSDVNNDGRTDYGVFRPQSGTWSFPGLVFQWGVRGDRVANSPIASLYERSAPSDFDGDRLTDLGVVRAVSGSKLRFLFDTPAPEGKTKLVIEQGKKGDLVTSGDFDGDGVSDLVTIEFDSVGQASWRIRLSSSETSLRPFGAKGDNFIARDFDGDGRTDQAAARPKPATDSMQWFLLPTSTGVLEVKEFGASGDMPLAADIDGDGKSDLIVVTNLGALLRWRFLSSLTGAELPAKFFGASGDRPVAGDFTGDAVAEIGVVRDLGGAQTVFVEATTQYNWGATGEPTSFGAFGSPYGLQRFAWRLKKSQGFFHVRSAIGGEESRPFGVKGDKVLDPVGVTTTDTLKIIADTTDDTDDGGSSDDADTGTDEPGAKRLKCTSTSSANKQSKGFVWKPVSESDGKLVVLFGSGYRGKILKVALVERRSSGDRVLETLRFDGIKNGNRPHFRAKKSGGSYPKNVILVRQAPNRTNACITVPNPSNRYSP